MGHRFISMRARTAVAALAAVLGVSAAASAQDAGEIVRRAEQHIRGETSVAEMTMKIVRPDWSREISLKAWTKGRDYSMILITAPARDRGTTYLMRGDEVWNWLPSVERVMKIPPSMMSQSWMGSDFTNDDLVKESSIVTDYTHTLLGDTTIAGYECWTLKLVPRPDAAVVWGKVLMWVDKQHDMQLRQEYYNDRGELEDIMVMSNVQRLGGRMIPATMTMNPADDPEEKTILRYRSLEFNTPIEDSFFTQRNMKRIRP